MNVGIECKRSEGGPLRHADRQRFVERAERLGLSETAELSGRTTLGGKIRSLALREVDGER